MHIKIIGAMETHLDVVPHVGNKSFTRNIGVDPLPTAGVPNVPYAASVTAFSAKHIAASFDELKGIELKRLGSTGVGGHLHPEIEDKVPGGVVCSHFVPPQCVAESTATHPEVAAGPV